MMMFLTLQKDLYKEIKQLNLEIVLHGTVAQFMTLQL